jgi:succinate dehydrogenase / fumarate reductase cytochrome b subunit
VNNQRYSWQRWTGFIALVFLFFHILHLHGWFHAELYLDLARHLGFASFRPYNAASTLVAAMQGYVWPAFYLVGVMACVYHLANGLWTAGITWGLWISPQAQERASKLFLVLGIGLAIVGASAWWAAVSPGEEEIEQWVQVENRMYDVATEAGLVTPSPEKRWERDEEERPEEAEVRITVTE